ncbi:hypothetical protein [Bordetella petrii]|uniref:hypothetical protein n=1 Tax=Bordetella petrii TaxID=94624 RepID=UPI00130542A8|nr:hypothetical protein [Bordetella petrii]
MRLQQQDRRDMDMAFLVEMKERLARARAGDWTEADMIEKMINDWIDELAQGERS